MSVMMPSVMMRRMKYCDPSGYWRAISATWLMQGAKLVGPYSWMRPMHDLYAERTPEGKAEMR